MVMGVAAARRTKVPCGNLPLPFSTARLLGAKAKALIPTGSLQRSYWGRNDGFA